MALNTKTKALALLSIVVLAMIVSGILLTTQAADTVTAANNETAAVTTETSDSTTATAETCPMLPGWDNRGMGFGRHIMGPGRHGFGGFGAIEVSEEFEETVTSIAENDTDVQNLIAEGYNVTSVNPIIKTVIDAEGDIVTKASSAVVMLQKDTTGLAYVTVDVEEAKVTQIVILTRTVIEK
jgi:hypothetical protein